MILLINACVRKESRTKRLADVLISDLVSRAKDGETRQEEITNEVEELCLSELSFPLVSEAFLQKRDRLLESGQFADPLFDLARQFAAADLIVIAAPYWDLSFPAALKQYLEQINVVGITFRYTKEGIPVGLCKAKKLYYVMTAGGNYVPEEFGFGYIKALATGFYGIADVELMKAVGMDLEGADAEEILKECVQQYYSAFDT